MDTRYFTPAEVAEHDSHNDLWVSFLGSVYDLTPLAEKYRGNVLLRPILNVAGQDISHWFNPKTQGIRTHISPKTGCKEPYTPQGRFIDVPPPGPDSDWDNSFPMPWWKDPQYRVGTLSGRTRKIRVVNMLTSQEQVLEVASEESLEEIQQRYVKYNAHAGSYTWKFMGKELNMALTLQQNHVPDEWEEFHRLNMDPEEFLPAISVYFNDDLTEDCYSTFAI